MNLEARHLRETYLYERDKSILKNAYLYVKTALQETERHPIVAVCVLQCVCCGACVAVCSVACFYEKRPVHMKRDLLV